MDTINKPDGDGLVIEIIGDEEPVIGPPVPIGNGVMDLFTGMLDMPLEGLSMGVMNISRMVAEPQNMDGALINPCTIVISPDGLGVSLSAHYNMTIDIPFNRLVAMVERMYTPNMATVVIQEHAVGGYKQPAQRQILGLVNPFYAKITILQSYSGEYLTEEKAPEVVQHFYVDRSELAPFYLTAKLHLMGMERRLAMDPYTLGWNGFDIPYAANVQRNELLKSRLEADFHEENER